MYTNSDCLSETKLVEISNYCDQNNLDIIAITEILPKFSLFQPEEKKYSLDGYDLFTLKLSQGRGCAIFANFPNSKGPGPIPKKGCESPTVAFCIS